MESKICPNCHTIFSRKPSIMKRYKFCSVNCRKESTHKNRKTECKICKKTFYPVLKNAQFCSQTCMGESYAYLDYSKSMFDEISEFFDGFMLSDGSISKNNPHLEWSVKHKEFDTYLKEVFGVYAPVSSERLVKDARLSDGRYITHRGNTKTHPDIKMQRKRWYPSDIKIVPDDVKITPKSLLMWYLGDGCRNPYSILLCTDSFAKTHVDHLIVKLRTLGLIGKIRYHCRNPRIWFSSSETKKFLKLIGEHSPIGCYKYKFDDSKVCLNRLQRRGHINTAIADIILIEI